MTKRRINECQTLLVVEGAAMRRAFAAPSAEGSEPHHGLDRAQHGMMCGAYGHEGLVVRLLG